MTVKTRDVGGRLVDAENQSFAGVTVHLVPRPSGAIDMLRSAVERDGRFRIERVPPGNYTLMVTERSNDGRWRSVARELSVVEDVIGLVLSAEPPVTIEGRLVGDDGRAVRFDTQGIMVNFEQRLRAGGVYNIAGRPDGDGVFTIWSAAGDNSVRVTGLPPHWFVKTTSLDGVDVTDEFFTLGGVGRRRLEVVVSDRGGRLKGMVTDRAGRTAPTAIVVAFPENRLHWMTGGRLIRSTFARQGGGFELDDLPPARYLVVAVTELPRNAWSDPDVLDRLSSAATAVHLEEGLQRELQLKVVAAPTDLFR